MSDPLIVVENLYKVFGARPERVLELLERGLSKAEIFDQTAMTVGVQDANFSVGEGEIFVVMGLSGSGKSTLLRLLNRLVEPTSGRVLLEGRDVIQMTRDELIEVRRHKMAMVFQSFALLPHLNVWENAAFGLEVAGVARDERRERALAVLERVGLRANAKSRPSELSGGMQQRVGLARALATDPRVLLMDEAFSALDPLIRTEMQDELLRLQSEQARTVVFISHDPDEALRIGDRIAIMEGGRVVQVGTAEQLLNEPADDYVRSFFTRPTGPASKARPQPMESSS
jgi:glycine betaine/proline transport system ATP-binding protein